jgi:NhaP-type Na+/H+ or K+/H+ antiporter
VLTFSIVLVLYAGMEALGANGLIAVLGFGLTLSNFPGIDPSLGLTGSVTALAESQQQLLTFHSELAFLVRTFFFVLIGAVAELGIFRQHPLLTAGILGALFLARWLAVHSSRWAWREIGTQGREAILWMLPRGLITVVLAIEAAEARPRELSFLPGLAFAVILATNLLVVLGSWRVQRVSPAVAGAPVAQPEEVGATGNADESKVLPASGVGHRRWISDVVLLTFLALGGLVLWAGNQSSNSKAEHVKSWIHLHLHR